ncbi:NAD-binding protein [Fomitiporia mediterranea MF3/22]|uniref:NAD-binding protein n=1 Tax=Fomitiporia mediterranea (strain MF3/22) TaxID=694068 RepID=UPI0004407A8D|nr:NAD-binding protein [Fomitiporia mediterranea MF3/22]EJD06311.1 NAD-binding protein [Fomitiporia mediterranea MF3/22]
MSPVAIPAVTREFRLTKQTGIEALRLTQSSVPTIKDGEVLVKIHAVSLQYRDLIITNGTYPMGAGENIVPGSDCAGEVLSVGSNVKNFKPGDRVSANFALEHIHGDIESEEQRATGLGGLIDGVLTECRTFPAYSLVKIPDYLSYEEASTLPCAALTAYNSLFGDIPLKGGDTVLVQGSGGVSVFALQIARANGANVIATTSSAQKAEVLKKLGATHVINYKQTPKWDEEVLKLTNGRGVDHIVEVAGAGTILQSINALRYSGSIHSVGFLAHVTLLGKAVRLRGVLIGPRKQFENMNRLFDATKIKPVVDRVFAFEDYPQALQYLASQQHVGKVVVKVTN